MLIKAILVAVWAGICAWDQYGPHLGFRKPLLAGAVTGLILGDLRQGLIIGATLELMWLGVNNVGTYVPPDVISGSVVGVAIGILSGGGEAAGIAIAIPVSLLVQQLDMLCKTLSISLVHKADKIAETGDFDKIDKLQYMGAGLIFLSRAFPTFIAVFLGASAIDSIMAFIPASIMTGLTVASKVIPAVGIAMLLTMMLKKNMWMFLVLGFTLTTYLGIPTLALALIGACFAGIYDLIMTKKEKEVAVNSITVEVDDSVEGGWDL
ncbi:MAG: PTS sugar transporter subunit IIC [Clostridium sp.]|uniref:PTS mannose/fructose/sorbose/N-acetylgalactosamine transporter subunit IIC n=1 Tax=Clostridium sp. TaxID=1506 RepID=UPI001DF9E518|nr:PTS sugar transporter subunit IIC [Clostridium sp.]MBS4803532.1 PTS sugar transporter subunit IIC [Clostridium sp.]MBS5949595.1 PTS sugar transporter subunit IIC [Clostridium sp.]MDU5110083.1 PTS sugar transporter subunit IIC [Clostridium sp.]